METIKWDIHIPAKLETGEILKFWKNITFFPELQELLRLQKGLREL